MSAEKSNLSAREALEQIRDYGGMAEWADAIEAELAAKDQERERMWIRNAALSEELAAKDAEIERLWKIIRGYGIA